MAPTTPTTEPSLLVAGDTAKWTTVHTTYPVSEGWVYTYYLRGRTVLEKAATAQSVDYLVTLGATDTAKLEAGTYEWALVASKSGERYTIRTGRLTVLTDIPDAEAGDLQAFPEKLLPLVEQEIYNRLHAQRSIERYAVANRSFDKIPTPELMAMRGRLKAELAAHRTGRFGVPIGAAFARPS